MESVEQALNRLENKLKVNMFEIEKRLTKIEERSEDEINERLHEIEDLILMLELDNIKIKQKIGKENILKPEETSKIPENILGKIENLEKRLAEQKQMPPTSLSSNELKKIYDILSEKASTQELDKFRHDIESIVSKISSGQSSLPEIEEIKHKYDMLEKKLDSRISELADSLETSGAPPTEKWLRRYIDTIKKTKKEISSEFRDIKKENTKLREGMKKNRNLLQKLEHLEADIEKADALLMKSRTIEEKIKNDINRLDAIKSGINSRIDNTVERINIIKEGIDARIEAKIGESIEKIESIKEEMKNKMKTLDDKIRAEIGKSESILKNFESKVNAYDENTKRILHMHDNLGADTRKSIEDIKSIFNDKFMIMNKKHEKISDEINRIDSELKEISALQKSLGEISKRMKMFATKNDMITFREDIKKMHEHSKRFATDKDFINFRERVEKHLKNEDADIDKTRKHLQEYMTQKTHQFSADMFKLRKKIEREVNEISGIIKMHDIKKIRDEINSMDRQIKNLEQSIDENTNKYLTKHLSDFSKYIDSRMPEFITRSDFSRAVADIERKISLIEAPNMRPVESRINHIERRIDEIYRILRGVSRQMPTIIE